MIFVIKQYAFIFLLLSLAIVWLFIIVLLELSTQVDYFLYYLFLVDVVDSQSLDLLTSFL